MTTHPPLYREILRQSWQMTFRHKILWALGVFAAFLGTGGALEILARAFDFTFRPVPRFMFSRPEILKIDIVVGLWGLALFILLAGLAAFLIFMIINSYGSLMAAADQLRAGKKINLGKIWHKTVRKFWPVLGLVVFFKFLTFVFSGLGLIPLWLVFLGKASPWLLFFYPLIFIVSVLAVLVCSFLMIYASDFVLLENFSWGGAVAGAWRIFIGHWLVNLEMAVIIFVVNLVFGLFLIAGLVLLAVPPALLFLFSYLINLPPLGAVAVFLGLFLGVLLILWSAAVLGAFHYSAWTLLWRRMHQGTAISKIIRIAGKIFKNKN